ncbi:MAG: hypothetical protein ACRDF4_00490 [Rhabdochlamydiaceae bacterium]
MTLTAPVSKKWYAFAFFFAFIGGIVAWAAIRGRSPKKAKILLVFGVLATVPCYFLVWPFFYGFFIGLISGLIG